MFSLVSDIAPYTANEYAALAKLLAGDCVEMELLRCQFDSIRFGSEYYRSKRLFFIDYRPVYLRRRGAETSLMVHWGEGAEDWMLGDRRPLTANDVLARLSDGTMVEVGILVAGGVLKKLYARKAWTASGEPKPTGAFNWRRTEIGDFLYFDGEDIRSASSERSSVKASPFSPPSLVEPVSELQRWLSDLHRLRIAPPRADPGEYRPRLMLGVRRAPPADKSELDRLEEELQVCLPVELRDFWAVTNGLSFLGRQVCGTYDTCVLDWPSEKRILLMPDPYGDGSIIAVETTVDAGEHSSRESARTFHYAPYIDEPVKVWGSIRDCFTHLASEAGAMSA